MRLPLLSLALKLLVRDRAKYGILTCSIAFCTVLVVQQLSVGCGLIYLTTANVRNLGAPIWVVDRQVEEANALIGLRDIEVDRVRSVAGVRWAVPVIVAAANARLADGKQEPVTLVGLDAATLVGRPTEVVAGRIEELRLPDAVFVTTDALETFSRKGTELKLGGEFEMNDRRARIVGICRAPKSLTGGPLIFATGEQARVFAPAERKRVSAVLVAPESGVAASELVSRLNQLSGLRAVTSGDFLWETVWFWVRNSAIPVSFGVVVLLGIIVGIAVAGQTFYVFIGDNLPYLAALKAMGATTGTLVAMTCGQTLAVGFLGFGLGVGLAAAFGAAALGNPDVPFLLPSEVIVFALGVNLLICLFAAGLALRRLAGVEPASVFR